MHFVEDSFTPETEMWNFYIFCCELTGVFVHSYCASLSIKYVRKYEILENVEVSKEDGVIFGIIIKSENSSQCRCLSSTK